jgi:hypothetical protein
MARKCGIDIFVVTHVVVGAKSRFHLSAVTFLGHARRLDIRSVDLHFNFITPPDVLLKAAIRCLSTPFVVAILL